MDISDPHWIGAWWIGGILSAALLLVIAAPLLILPSEIEGSERYRTDRMEEMHYDSAAEEISKLDDFGKRFYSTLII